MLTWTLVASILTGCSLKDRSDDDSDTPARSYRLSLAASFRVARVGEKATVRAFVMETVEGHMTDDGFLEGTRYTSGWTRPVRFDVESASCPDDGCVIERVGEWSEGSGRDIEMVPTASSFRLHVVSVGGLESEVELSAEP